MRKLHTPSDAATAVMQNPALPAGDDERVVGYGVMGFPFTSGHYLALRYFPATSFSPGYRSVWHRDPGGVWTFYATTPGQQSCARYFSSATPNAAVQCAIDVAWTSPWSLLVGIAGVLEWHVDIRATPSTRLTSTIAGLLPACTWTNELLLGMVARAVRPVLRAGHIQLSGTVPNGQRFMIAPTQVWTASGRAVLRGEDLGPVGPLDRQARLADFRPPQRGLFVVGSGHFETFETAKHRAAERTVSIG